MDKKRYPEHLAIYDGMQVCGKVVDDPDVDGWMDKWVMWYDRYGNQERARMKKDAYDHFYPPTKSIKEEDIIGWSKI